MKDWDKATPEEIKEEMDKTIGVVTDETRPAREWSVPFEGGLYTTRFPVLHGMYSFLFLLSDYDLLSGINHKELAKFLQLSEPTFLRYRDALVKHNLIRLTQNKLEPKALDIRLLAVPELDAKQKSRMLRTFGKAAKLKLLSEWRDSIHPLSDEERLEQQKLLKHQEVQTLFDMEVKEKAKEIVQKEKAKAKAEEQKFPSVDYKSVLDGYRKYKGIGIHPHSPEEARYKKAIKNMFLSGHKVFDILECMRFFNKYANREGYEWMAHWTIETIGKKIAEHKSGALKIKEMGDDLPVL